MQMAGLKPVDPTEHPGLKAAAITSIKVALLAQSSLDRGKFEFSMFLGEEVLDARWGCTLGRS